MSIVKDPSMTNLIATLALSDREWRIVDDWEADLCAIGITSEAANGKLVYICTFGKEPGTFDYDCDIPTGTSDPSGFQTVASGKDANLNTLESVLETWLR